mmetsp:Transcript_20948/g.67427  ORF Transcript_20948/g.67427 Transcript_20948/m.67427 type:complete len:213 (+) Transcript_20948:1173-1811(+)
MWRCRGMPTSGSQLCGSTAPSSLPLRTAASWEAAAVVASEGARSVASRAGRTALVPPGSGSLAPGWAALPQRRAPGSRCLAPSRAPRCLRSLTLARGSWEWARTRGRCSPAAAPSCVSSSRATCASTSVCSPRRSSTRQPRAASRPLLVWPTPTWLAIGRCMSRQAPCPLTSLPTTPPCWWCARTMEILPRRRSLWRTCPSTRRPSCAQPPR